MMVFDPDVLFLYLQGHGASKVVTAVGRKIDVIAGLVFDVIIRFFIIGIPFKLGFVAGEAVADLIGADVYFAVVEDIEFKFRTDQHLIRYAGFLQIFSSTA